MKKIGISYYPDFYDDETCVKMLDKAYNLGYRIIFTSFVLNDYGFENTNEGITEKTIFFLDYAAEKGFEVRADITRKILYQLGDSTESIKKLSSLKISVIRLDGGFTDEEVVQLTLNKDNMKIEDNLSNYRLLDNRLEKVANQGNINNYMACHNFYPRSDTGISLEDAISGAKLFKSYGIKTGIFIGSLSSKSDLNALSQSTMTVEEHRYIPTHIQITELLCTEVFDYFIFGDSNPSEDELKNASIAFSRFTDNDKPVIGIPSYFEPLPEHAMMILKDTIYHPRTDVPEQVVRGVETRKKIELQKNNILKRDIGTITIDNIHSAQYRGELQIVLKEFPPAKNANVIGYVKPYALRLLPYLKNINFSFKLV